MNSIEKRDDLLHNVDNQSILIVEDDAVTALLIRKILTKNKYTVTEVLKRGEDVISSIDNLKPGLILMDITLKGEMSGIDAAKEVGRSVYNLPILYLSADADEKQLESAQKTSPYGFIHKPINEQILLYNIKMSLYTFERDKELAKSEETYRRLIQNSQIGVAVYNSSSDLTFTNRYAEEYSEILNNLSGNGANSDSSYRFIKEDETPIPVDENPLNVVIRNGKQVKKYVLGVSNGSPEDDIWLLINAYPEYGNNLNIEKVVVTFIDITKRVNSSKAVLNSEQLYSTVLDNTSDMIFLLDLVGNITFANTSARVHYNIEDTYLNSTMVNLSYLWSDESIDVVLEGLEKTRNNRIKTVMECKCIDRYYEVSLIPIMDNSSVVSIICTVKDLTNLIQDKENLKKALNASINTTVKIVEIKDPYTAGHQHNVAILARDIALEMNLTNEQVDTIWAASQIHDIGKIDVPSDILCKPTRLTEKEFAIIMEHPDTAYRILVEEYPLPFAEIVRQHHEKINGTGYPLGLKGDDIMLEAKVISVADVVDAIASDRPYRQGLGIEKAIEEITKNKNIIFDGDVVNAALRILEKNKLIMSQLSRQKKN